jgi:hypothetical protein
MTSALELGSDEISVTINPAGALTAYNDLAWAGGQLNSNITMITSANGGSGLPSSGQLIDFAGQRDWGNTHGDGWNLRRGWKCVWICHIQRWRRDRATGTRYSDLYIGFRLHRDTDV